jgi:hypothetical protein
MLTWEERQAKAAAMVADWPRLRAILEEEGRADPATLEELDGYVDHIQAIIAAREFNGDEYVTLTCEMTNMMFEIVPELMLPAMLKAVLPDAVIPDGDIYPVN